MSWAEYLIRLRNTIESLMADDLMTIKWILFVLVIIVFFMLVVPVIFLTYPFKTTDFIGNPPIEILNKDKKVENGSVVEMKVNYEKFVNVPALAIRTLVRTTSSGDTLPLDSSTVVSIRLKGKGTSYPVFLLNLNPKNIGKDCRIIFSLYYTLYGFRHISKQYISEPFEIVPTTPENKSRLQQSSNDYYF